MSVLRRVWQAWLKFGFVIGNIVSAIILGIFYFTFFALFAIPFRIFGVSFFKARLPDSNWINKEKTLLSLNDFESE